MVRTSARQDANRLEAQIIDDEYGDGNPMGLQDRAHQWGLCLQPIKKLWGN